MSDRLLGSVDAIEGIDESSREKLRFMTRAFVDAMSPSNFALTNPQVIERAIETRGESLLAGLEHMLHDLSKGQLTHTDPEAFEVGPTDTGQWALAELRSTSPWAVAAAVAALGRHHSTPWLAQIDVPTAVVVTAKDRVIPPERQRSIAAHIPGATAHEADCGHSGCVMNAEEFLPAFLQAVNTTNARVRSRMWIPADTWSALP